MNNPFTRIAAACLCFSLSACGGINLWPFGGGEKFQDRTKAPANATAYQCAGGKRFYVRNLEDGAAVWLILPDREVRLEKSGNARYSSGMAVLDLSGSEPGLADGPVVFKDCKAATPA